MNLSINGRVRLRDLLRHLYALIPEFGRQKHYWIGSDEVEKLLRHGETTGAIDEYGLPVRLE